MKIGILTYHSACNFGANLQILSSVGYLRNRGFEPFVINYEAEDYVRFYQCNTPSDVYNAYEQFRKMYMPLSKHCSSAEDIAQVVEQENVEAIIIGSDAVAQHHSFLERCVFPTRKIVSVRSMTKDRLFPNPFWGTFVDHLRKPLPMALLSASSQDSNYRLFTPALKKQMWMCLQKFSFVSARDEWTQKMYKSISGGKLDVEVTPDPVFAFNNNCATLIPTKEEILNKFCLPEKYVLLSFLNSQTVSLRWLEEFQSLAEQQGISCVALPFPQGLKFQHCLRYEISSPLLPLDWYALIKYSQGYVGHNMHPIVVSLHNANPFFSFDNYGMRKLNGLWIDDSSSKIKHILTLSGLHENRVSCLRRSFSPPKPQFVFERLYCFDRRKAWNFSCEYLNLYERMMSNLINAFR